MKKAKDKQTKPFENMQWWNQNLRPLPEPRRVPADLLPQPNVSKVANHFPELKKPEWATGSVQPQTPAMDLDLDPPKPAEQTKKFSCMRCRKMFKAGRGSRDWHKIP